MVHDGPGCGVVYILLWCGYFDRMVLQRVETWEGMVLVVLRVVWYMMVLDVVWCVDFTVV